MIVGGGEDQWVGILIELCQLVKRNHINRHDHPPRLPAQQASVYPTISAISTPPNRPAIQSSWPMRDEGTLFMLKMLPHFGHKSPRYVYFASSLTTQTHTHTHTHTHITFAASSPLQPTGRADNRPLAYAQPPFFIRPRVGL
ncbi:unnamed protein product [Protopolystoma xenopodis]|uniref:Uncharacterized protein n=1 Tax=Protopolystoma xenopodis TaxID=117903 RepID=A0A3S5FFH9_9PLAT|nr:unnamed protein product [Protopolystoma xenopodis]